MLLRYVSYGGQSIIKILFTIPPAQLLISIAKAQDITCLFVYLDYLAWNKRQLLCSRLIVGRHCSRVVWVKSHKESDGGYGHLARSLEFPFSEILRSSDPHFIWEYQNIQLQPCLHLQQQSARLSTDRWLL